MEITEEQLRIIVREEFKNIVKEEIEKYKQKEDDILNEKKLLELDGLFRSLSARREYYKQNPL